MLHGEEREGGTPTLSDVPPTLRRPCPRVLCSREPHALTLVSPHPRAQYFNYTDTKLHYFSDAVLSGNPSALLAVNDGVKHPISRYSAWETYTCGESNDFTEIPASRYVNGSQWHELSFLGTAWAAAGVRYPAPVLGAYLAAVNSVGGAVSIDAQLFRNGSINSQQVAVLAAAAHRTT